MTLVIERAGRFHRRNQFRIRLVGGNGEDVLVGERQPNHDDCVEICEAIQRAGHDLRISDTTGLAL